MNKKGLELSLTVIVTLIISILIFIGGIAMVWKFFAGAEEIKSGIEQQTKNQIEALLRQGTEIVAIPVNTQTIPVGKEATFGLGIRNIGEDRGFYVGISYAGIYDKSGKPLGMGTKEHIEQHWLGAFKTQGPINIRHNKYEIVPLRIRTASTVDEGITTPKQALVVFNVCVFTTETMGECDPKNPGIYDKVRQIFIETK
ncbi:MAG: hypothetical protein QXR48_01380 [Candidatus Woesearchaeota archaeon]